MEKVKSAVITGTGSYVPEKILKNEDFEKFLDTSDEWITSRTGIKERRIATENDGTASMAAHAARSALADAQISAQDLDLIIVATFTPEMPLPATACFVQQALGAKDAAAFDIAAACSGFVYALSVARQFIGTGKYRNVLVIGAETLSRFCDYQDRGSCILFGDGAGAVVLSASDQSDRGLLYTHLAADGQGWDLLQIPAGGSRSPASNQTVKNREHYLKLRGKEVYKFAVQKMQFLLKDAMTACKLTTEAVAMVVPHQVNTRIIDSACQHLGFPREKIYVNIDRMGNTSAASVPIALDEASRTGKVNPGDVVIMIAFGAGLTWASAVVRL